MRGARQTGSLLLLAALAAPWPGEPAARVRAGEDKKPPSDKPERDAFEQRVRPVLAKYCFSCHGEKKQSVKLNLASFSAEAKPQDWKRVWERLRSRQMPPADQPQPTAAERALLLDWIEGLFARHTLDGQPDPGPLPPRRLN